MPVSAFELLALSDRDRIFYQVLDPTGATMTGYPDLSDPRKGLETPDKGMVAKWLL